MSTARPEHLGEFATVRDRRRAKTIPAPIGRLVDSAAQGALCDAARPALDSRLVFLRKKSGAAPPPIRVGELRRRAMAKRAIDADRCPEICRAARLFGVAAPGGAEGLVHFRARLGRGLQAVAGAAAVVDVGWKNASPPIERGSIWGAVQELLPEAAAWTW